MFQAWGETIVVVMHQVEFTNEARCKLCDDKANSLDLSAAIMDRALLHR